MALTQAHVFVSGLVQGVYFREYARRQAAALGITGWVRNLSDGRVEAIFQGEEPDVHSIVQWCHQGPPRARVDRVDVDWQSPTEEFRGFQVQLEWYY